MAQSTGATFGDVIRLGSTPSDIVLDESRGYLYLVNANNNRVDIYSYQQGALVGSVPVGTYPVAACMSMDKAYLYVSNNTSNTLTAIRLDSRSVAATVSLTAAPEGCAVGADGRVLITTNGTSTTDQINSLLLYDPSLDSGSQVTQVTFAPPPSTPTTISTTTTTRQTTTFRGKLAATADGAYIIGMSTINNNASTIVFVYETASASVLRSRTVTGQSTVLSLAPDGSRFMAGYTLYDTATLAVTAQQSTNNIPFPITASTTTTATSTTSTTAFSTLANVGGSTFSSDGETLYSAFNVAANTTPAPRTQASTLLISSGRHLAGRLGIKMPESIIAKMVMTADGSEAWGLSESGLIYLPLGKLYEYPIIMPETTQVFLAQDLCNPGVAKGTVKVVNIGGGKLTFAVPDTGSALVAQTDTGVAPGTITFMTEPGRTSVTRYAGTNLYSVSGSSSSSSSNTGSPLSVNLASATAINIPNTIRVYMNYRLSDQRGVIYPVPVTGTTEGLQDILVDEARDKVYITNSGYNRIEVFDRTKQMFVDPIEVGQLPHQMAMGLNGSTLYVANTGGESISIVDLDKGKLSGSVKFPAYPRTGNSTPTTPQAIYMGLYGLQVIMSDGTQWKVVDNLMSLRATNSVTPTKISTTTATGPPRMVGEPTGRYAIAMGGTAIAYLYDGLSDTFTTSNRPYTTSSTLTGYFGPLAAGPDGNYFLLNGLVLNSSLAAIGGSELPSSTTNAPLASRRNVAMVGVVDSTRFVRVTTVVKSSLTTSVTTDVRPILELADISRGSAASIGPLAENPVTSVFGSTRANVPPRQIAVDSKGNVYAITLSGVTVASLTTGAARPAITGGAAGIVDANTGAKTLTPGSFVSITGTNLGSQTVVANQVPLPTVLGGSCLMFSDTAVPILQSSPGKIVAQIPDTLKAGPYVVQVRSLANGQQSDPVTITLQNR